MHAVRLGAMQALRLIPTAIEFVASELSRVETCENTGASWKEDMLRIDQSAWISHCRRIYDSCFDIPDFEAKLNALPPPLKLPQTPHSALQVVPEQLQREARKLQADPSLWGALENDLRQTLLKERGEGEQFDRNSLKKAKRLEDGSLLLESGLIFNDRMDHCRFYFN